FTGREDILGRLSRRFFAPHGELSRRIFVLYGLGGSGKTQICLKFCERFKARYVTFWGVFWIDATSNETTEESFKEIARLLQIDRTPAAVRQHLSTSEEQWLLIFDNADNLEIDISKHFPHGGNILITTRNPGLSSDYAPQNDAHFEVDKMELDEAVSLLLLKVGRTGADASNDTRADAEHLVNDLGSLALAVDQAGSYIAARKCMLSEYRQMFKNRRDRNQLLREQLSKQRSSSYQPTVYTTWEISIQMVQETNPLASEILQLFSYLHYAQIPREIFKRASDRVYDADAASAHWTTSRMSKEMYNLLSARKGDSREEWNEDIFEREIDTLQSFSLVKRERFKDQVIYNLHPLVSSWTREKLPPAKELPFQHAIVCILNRSIQTTFEDTATDLRFRRQLFVHVEAVLGQEHPYTLTNVAYLASTYRNQGRWKEAEELEVQVMETSSRVLGQEHPSTLTSMANLAATYRNQGRWKEAEELEVQVMETRKRVLGQEHPSTLTGMANLASTYRNQGRWKEAEELEVQVMETRKRVLGQEHPSTLTSMANLASTFWNQGRWKEAEELEVQVMETSLKVLGQEHPDTLTSMHNLAHTYKSNGHLDKAIALIETVVPLRSRILGEDHPFTRSSTETLASWRDQEQPSF
ncbi:P-loop containing nucleoside triphosphate hydrolase protein, partial [Trichophaea hybrida]